MQGRGDILRPITAVGEDAAAVMHMFDKDVRGVGCDDEFHRAIRGHHAGHARRDADIGRIVPLSAFCLVRHAGFENGLGLRRQWRLLRRTEPLCLIVARLAGDAGDGYAAPCAGPVGILGLIEGLRIDNHRDEAQCDGADQAAVKHYFLRGILL